MTTTKNKILASLSPNQFKKFELIKLAAGEVLYKQGTDADHIFFIEDAVVALEGRAFPAQSERGGAAAALVGYEGVAPVEAALGACQKHTTSGFVLVGGWARKIARADMRWFQGSIAVYAICLIGQLQVNACCHLRHSLEQRLAKTLLMCAQRIKSKDIHVTHEHLARVLGTFRPNVTAAALTLKEKGLIEYTRGHVTIIDKAGLVAASCECFASIKNQTY